MFRKGIQKLAYCMNRPLTHVNCERFIHFPGKGFLNRYIMGLSSSHVDMNSPLAAEIKQTVADNRIVIYSKTYCSYCRNVKNLLGEMNTDYRTIELDKHSNGQMMQDILTEMTGGRTVPRVFVNGKCIGGYSETSSLHKSGKLESMLKEDS